MIAKNNSEMAFCVCMTDSDSFTHSFDPHEHPWTSTRGPTTRHHCCTHASSAQRARPHAAADRREWRGARPSTGGAGATGWQPPRGPDGDARGSALAPLRTRDQAHPEPGRRDRACVARSAAADRPDGLGVHRGTAREDEDGGGLCRARTAASRSFNLRASHTRAHTRGEAQSTASAGQGVGERRRAHRHPRRHPSRQARGSCPGSRPAGDFERRVRQSGCGGVLQRCAADVQRRTGGNTRRAAGGAEAWVRHTGSSRRRTGHSVDDTSMPCAHLTAAQSRCGRMQIARQGGRAARGVKLRTCASSGEERTPSMVRGGWTFPGRHGGRRRPRPPRRHVCNGPKPPPWKLARTSLTRTLCL